MGNRVVRIVGSLINFNYQLAFVSGTTFGLPLFLEYILLEERYHGIGYKHRRLVKFFPVEFVTF